MRYEVELRVRGGAWIWNGADRGWWAVDLECRLSDS